MKFNEIKTEEKVRLDPKCWTGKKIGNPKTKVKGGVRVNNCVPKEGVEEGKLGATAALAGAIALGGAMGYKHATKDPNAEPTAASQAFKTKYERNAEVGANLKKKISGDQKNEQGVAEGQLDEFGGGGFPKTPNYKVGDSVMVKGYQGVGKIAYIKHRDDVGVIIKEPSPLRVATTIDDLIPKKGVAEAAKGIPHKVRYSYDDPSGNGTASGHITLHAPDKTSAARYATSDLTKRGKKNVRVQAVTPQTVAEDFNPEYDDEAGMADNNLSTLRRAVDGLDDLIDSGDNLPEWCQEKIAVAKSMLVAVWDYMESADDSEEDPEIAEMYEAMEELAEEMAHKNRVSIDAVWESLEALDDHMLYETAAWRRKEGKSKSGGLNAKGVASYRRENPGSKLQTAVTTKPSKLKPGSKAAKRRKSFCARMSGVKGPMKKPNGKPTRKALALRKWNC